MSKKKRLSLIVISLLGLLDVMFLPVFSVFGGLFPGEVQVPFLEVFDLIFNEQGAFELWVVRFTAAILISFFMLLIAALFSGKLTFIITDALCIVLITVQIIQYSAQTKEIHNLFDFEKTSLSVGTWVAILFYISAIFIVLYKKSENAETTVNPSASDVEEQGIPSEEI